MYFINRATLFKIAFLMLGALFAFQPELQAKHIEINAQQAWQLIQAQRHNPDFIILDIRTPEEFGSGHIAGARLINFYDPLFATKIKQLPRNKTYLFYCRTGRRTSVVMSFLKKLGFEKVYHLNTGIEQWRAQRLALIQGCPVPWP